MTVQGWFGTNFIENYTTALEKGKASTGSISVALMMWEQSDYGFGNCGGKNFDFHSFRLCHRLFPLSFQNVFFLDDFRDLDAAGRSPHSADV